MENKLKKNCLGSSNIEVSSLCFGTLTVSPLQCGLSVNSAADLFMYAIDSGINFFDTAALYDTYEPLKKAVKYNRDIIIATKDYCYDTETAEKSVDTALKGIGRGYIDIFLLHEQESINTIKGHWEAIEHLIKRKEKGDIKSVGISTHFVSAVKSSLAIDEIEIVHPIYNKKGLGIADGNRDMMRGALDALAAKKKGIYIMKALGGGHLCSDATSAFREVLSLKGVSSVAVGMKSKEEVDYNVSFFSGSEPDEKVKLKLDKTKRNLHIHDWCTGCGKCVESCDREALEIIGNMAVVNHKKCVMCGYCAQSCKEFCIKVI